jgi:predicted NUDIX family NTP pyrophosphohydrolase
MGGPFWARKDEGAWTIPKGEFHPPESAKEAAMREFQEETGIVPTGTLVPLPVIRQAGGKVVHAWSVEMDCDITRFKSNTFRMEWPKGSGRQTEFAEVDKIEWFTIPEARKKILKSQLPLLNGLGA